jgi:D-glycero-D-manno-heptose 1,7-bisphosphate phosphatase
MMVDAADSIERPMALLDRDGVINRDIGYAFRPDQIQWIDGLFPALRLLGETGYRIVVVTNQSGVARGFYSEDDVEALHRWMADEIRAQGGSIAAFYHCPYHPEASVDAYRCDHPDRKPRPGMLIKAMARFATDRANSFMIGDKPSDLAAAQAAGVAGHIFAGGRLDHLVESIVRRV